MLNKDLLPPIYRYCAYQDRCTQEVVRKLRELEAHDDEIPELLDHLRAERFLDEERFARSFARGKFSYKHWGRIKIRHELQQKGVPAYLIDLAIREEIDAQAYYQKALRLQQRKLSEQREQDPLKRQQKVQRYLSQKGYEWRLIREVWEDRE